ncbi:MAG TPA: DnaD domain protein [Anaerolineales bacterium]
MKKFKGFSESESFTQLPDAFFHQLLQEIEDAAELKVTLHFLWRAQKMEGSSHGLRERDFDPKGLGLAADGIRRGLEGAVQRGTLLKAENEAGIAYFMNSPRGRASAEAFSNGQAGEASESAPAAPIERPNIFKMYEENIGPLTPLIADALKDAEATYSPEWAAAAIELAVKNNKRNWKYCEAILKRWKEEGRGEKQDRRDAEKDRDKYVKGEYADYVEH